MSRSRKKPYFTDQQNGDTKWVKQKASRFVRNLKLEDTPKNGKAYRKEFESYNIRDWAFYCPTNKKAHRK